MFESICANMQSVTEVEVKWSKKMRSIQCFQIPSRFQKTMFLALGYAPISSSDPRPLGTAYVPILLSEVEQEQKPSGNGDREAIVVGAGLCDGEDERAYTVYDPILEREREKTLFSYETTKHF